MNQDQQWEQVRRVQLERTQREFIIRKLWKYDRAGQLYRDVTKSEAIELLMQHEANERRLQAEREERQLTLF